MFVVFLTWTQLLWTVTELWPKKQNVITALINYIWKEIDNIINILQELLLQKIYLKKKNTLLYESSPLGFIFVSFFHSVS